ncbi:nucleotidyltransferase [Vibrio parahaemolyticus]|nr:nucleotidyltransferase [Vibrio parahaemolyticus]TOK75076.1 nucleotidyltransferase [Vibrio parahaemolyticus]
MADFFTCLIAALLQPALQFQQDVRFYKVGVGLINLVEEQYEQPDLLNLNPNNPKLMNVYDTLNNQLGRDTVFLTARGISQKWSMRRQMITPQYTTRRVDLPQIRCSLSHTQQIDVRIH